MKVIEKAWGINWDKIEEGSYYAGNIGHVYAKTKGKAKSLLLNDISEYKLLESGEDIEYTTIPLQREKILDKCDFGGRIMTEMEHNEWLYEEEKKKKLENIINDKEITHCYIKKNGSYYGDNYCGYTQFLTRAGVYKKQDAVKCVNGCRELKIEPIINDEHNKHIYEEISKLRNRLIKGENQNG